MSLKLGMMHQALELYKVCINHKPGMTLTYFTTMSTYVAYAFEWGKLLKWDLMGKTCRKWVYKLEIQDSEKNFDPRGGSASALGHYTCIHDNHYIQRSSLKQLGQSKSYFIGNILMKGKPM